MFSGTLVRRWLHRVAPEGTKRRKVLRIPNRLLRALKQYGLRETLRRIRAKVRRHLIGNSNDRLQQWYAYSNPSHATLAEQRARQWPPAHPTIDLVVCVTRGDFARALRSFRSLRAQTYSHWQLQIIAHDICAKAIQRAATRIVGAHRIRVYSMPADVNPSAHLNVALNSSCADFLGLLAAGDLLAPNAFYEFAALLLDDPDCDVVYADEDCVSAGSMSRHGLVLKPDWSPEMLLGQNYIGRACLIRREILQAIGGFRSELGAAQLYDALLRVAEVSLSFCRVPMCLYHREAERRHSNLTPEAARLHAEAARQHMNRRGFEAAVTLCPNGTHRVTWPIANAPRVSVIIPTLNNLKVLKVCIDGLLHKTAYPSLEIVLVDNASTDLDVHQYYEELTAAGLAKIVRYHKEFNYSEACNLGARAADGDIFLFLNNDSEVIRPDWLEEMVRFCLLPGVGCVGTRLLYPDGIVQHAGVVIGMHLTGLVYNRTKQDMRDCFGGSNIYRNLLAIMGACQMVSREAFEAVGGFDERYRIANSDVALCLRAHKAGYRTVYTPYAELYHHEGYTRGKVNPIEDIELTARDIRDMEIAEDPYFHPDLSAHHAVPTLRLYPELTPREFMAKQLDELDPSGARPKRLIACDDDTLRRTLGPSWYWLPWPAWTLDEVADCDWAAARFAVRLLLGSQSLRERFPRALSEGIDGEYCRWLCAEAAPRLGLKTDAIRRVRNAFRMDLAARVRQVFEFRPDLRAQFPTGLLPKGKVRFLHWLVVHGTQECELRQEQIWWFLQESEEDPLRELIHTYLITPEWQAFFPEAMSESGWPRFYQWVCRRYELEGIDGDNFVSLIRPLDQMRLLYQHRGRWRLKFPRAFHDRVLLRQLTDWLRSSEGRELSACPVAWLDRVDNDLTVEDPKVGLNIVGHFQYPSGLQVSVRSVAESLRRLGVPTSLRDVPAELATDKPGRGDYLGQEIHDVTLIHVQPEPFWESAFIRAGLELGRHRYRVGMWYWEFGEVPPQWRKHAELVRELWAPTQFIAEALRSAIPLPVYPMLPGVELDQVKPISREKFGLPEDKFLFLFMYDMNSIQERKNPLGLIEAFKEAFRHDDRVALAIKVSRGQNNPDEFARLTSAARRAGVLVVDKTVPRNEAYGLVQACDCYVSLHRSEGLGLTMAEAMLLGKPVIATNYSGNVDFMSPQDSMLVGYKLVHLERDIQPYKRGYLWAEPSRAEAAHWMRWAFDHPDEAKELGQRGQTATKQVLSMEASGQRLLARLHSIAGRTATVTSTPATKAA